MPIATLTLELLLPGCTTLKEKRGRLKPLISALRKEFNVAAAEMGHQDHHRMATLGLVTLGNDARTLDQFLAVIPRWIETHRPDLELVDHRLEILE